MLWLCVLFALAAAAANNESFGMTMGMWLSYVIALVAVWWSVASIVAAIRLRFWPLILQGLSFGTISILATIVPGHAYPRGWFVYLFLLGVVGYASMYVYEFRPRAGRRLWKQGVTLQTIMLFRTPQWTPTFQRAMTDQEHR